MGREIPTSTLVRFVGAGGVIYAAYPVRQSTTFIPGNLYLHHDLGAMIMAIKARRFKDAKAQAKSNPELVWWVFMRLSGTALVLLTLFHLFKNHISVDEAGWDYETVASSYANWWNKFYLFALLGLGLLHGGNGIRYVIEDATAKNPTARVWAKGVAFAIIGAVLVFGLLALIVKIPIPGVDN